MMPPAPAVDGVLDQARLDGLLEAFGPEMVKQFTDLLARSADSNIALMKAAAASGDAGALGRAAHALRGTCLNLGARTMSEICQELEMCGHKQELARTTALLEGLDRAWAATRPELERHCTPAA